MTSKEYFDYFSEEMQNRGGCITNPVMLVVLLLVVMCLFGCKTQYVSVPEYHTEYVYRTDSVRLKDSIYVHDSIFAETRNDTVFLTKIRKEYIDRWRDVVRIDSFIKTDSVRVPYPVPQKLTKWQQVCCDYGKIMIGATVVGLIAMLVAVILWIKRRAI